MSSSRQEMREDRSKTAAKLAANELEANKQEREAERRRLEEAKEVERRRLEEAKEAERRHLQEAKEAERRHIQEAKDAAAAQEPQRGGVLGSLFRAVQGGRDTSAEKAREAEIKAGEAKDATKEAAARKVGEAKEAAAGAAGEMKDWGAGKAREGKEKALEIKDAAAGKLREGTEKAREYKGTAEEKAREYKDAAEEKAREGKDTAVGLAKKAMHYLTTQKEVEEERLSEAQDAAKGKTAEQTELDRLKMEGLKIRSQDEIDEAQRKLEAAKEAAARKVSAPKGGIFSSLKEKLVGPTPPEHEKERLAGSTPTEHAKEHVVREQGGAGGGGKIVEEKDVKVIRKE